jgi:hypothetical protein
MAQTTDSIWGGAAYVGISTDGAAWTEIGSHAMKVSPEGGDRTRDRPGLILFIRRSPQMPLKLLERNLRPLAAVLYTYAGRQTAAP